MNICEDICAIIPIGLLLRKGPRVCGGRGLLTTKLTLTLDTARGRPSCLLMRDV